MRTYLQASGKGLARLLGGFLLAGILTSPFTVRSQPEEEIPMATPIPAQTPLAPPEEDLSSIPRAEPVVTPAGIPVATPVEAERLEPTAFDGLPTNPALPIAVQILSPTPQSVVDDPQTDIFLKVENYKLAKGGNCIHLIHNNEAPISIYDLKRPLTLKNLAIGGHSLRAFAVKPNGESFSENKAFSFVHFYVHKKDFQNYVNTADPFLTVNLPSSGTVDTDESGRVTFDYRLHNGFFDPSKGYKLKYRISGFEGTISKTGPVYWANLPRGKHTLLVQLYDSQDNPAPGVFNHVEREFEIRKVLKAVPLETEENTDSTAANQSETPPNATTQVIQ